MAADHPDRVADDLLRMLPASPDAYPQKLDLIRGAVLLVRLDESAYRAASFLDDRILSPATVGAWLPAAAVADRARHVTSGRPVHFVFHTGHVGSTLLTRLLDETGRALSLREPLTLRTIADAHDVADQPESLLSGAQLDVLLETFVRLWGRGYDATRVVVVKATSSAGRLATPLLVRNARSRAVYMNLRAEPYLATLLAGENSPLDLRGHAPGRMRRLCARVAASIAPVHSLSLGELAAMSWLAETWTQQDAAKRFPDRIIALDFDRFLADVGGNMERILAHFELPADAHFLAGVARSSCLTRYSKAPEFAYTPATRVEVLDDSRRANRDEIRKGMEWLHRLARSDAGAAAVLNAGGL